KRKPWRPNRALMSLLLQRSIIHLAHVLTSVYGKQNENTSLPPGQQDGKGGAAVRGAGHRDPAPMGFGNALGDGQPQTIAPLSPVPGGICPVEPLEQVGQVFRRNGSAGVVDAEAQLVLLAGQRNPDLRVGWTGVFHRIVQQN